jgi:hypothetical protein
VHDIKQGMSSMEESIFRHVVRGANYAAHILAIEACTHVTNKLIKLGGILFHHILVVLLGRRNLPLS